MLTSFGVVAALLAFIGAGFGLRTWAGNRSAKKTMRVKDAQIKAEHDRPRSQRDLSERLRDQNF
jgi:hypothetical protein|tara:strand:+ start:656 stop:847 length:192 start_codon:yes stop_codon:yes gene_type:complete